MTTRIFRPERRLAAAAASFLLLGALVAGAAVVDKVVVKSDVDVPAPEELVRANMSSAPGTVFSPRLLSEDIKRLYQTGNFEDIRTEVTESPGDKVVITVVVIPKRAVRKIIIEGNHKIKTKRLRGLLEHKEGTPLSETQVAADTNAIRKRYRDSGYYKAEVDSIIQEIPNTHEVNLLFRIKEQERAKLKGVSFSGNTVFEDKELRQRIRTRRPWWRYILRWGNYLNEDQLKTDEDVLRGLYTGKGYLDFGVVGVEREYNKKKTWVSLTYTVEEGKPYTVSSLEIVGAERFSKEELGELVKLEREALYNSDTEAGDIERIRSKYEALGYIDLKCYPRRRMDNRTLTVAIEYRINEGVPAHIRDVYITGNEVTKDHVIRRELAIHPGDLGDAGKIRASKSRLMNLNYFEKVDITPVTTEKEDEKDLLIKVAEKRTGQLMVGAGFSSEDAVLGFLEVTQANFDWRDWPTFRGGGQRLRLRTQLGTKRTDVMVSFTEPWWLHRRLRLQLDGYSNSRTEDEYEQKTLGVGAAVSRPWRKFWRQSAGAQVRQIKLVDFDDDVSQELKDEEGRYEANSLTFGVSRDSRNHFLYPTRGSRLSLDTELRTEAIGSYSNVYRVNLRGTKYLPLPRRAVLKVQGDVGVTDRVSGDGVAIFDRYFAGGAYSVRGFKRREVSPVDVNEDPVGGKSTLLSTVEYIHPIFEKVRGSVFCDAGNVWRGTGDIDPSDLNASIGLGVQLDLPIGPIRFDYGWPVVTQQDHLDDSNGRLHFNIGYSF